LSPLLQYIIISNNENHLQTDFAKEVSTTIAISHQFFVESKSSGHDEERKEFSKNKNLIWRGIQNCRFLEQGLQRHPRGHFFRSSQEEGKGQIETKTLLGLPVFYSGPRVKIALMSAK
jgi:hypothetical protein